MKKIFRKKSSMIITFLLAILVGLGVFGGISISRRLDKLEPTKTVSASAYSRGLLSDLTGRLPKNSEDIDYSGIHMNGYVNVDGLICEIAKDAKIKYEINFYDEDYTFIEVLKMTADYDAENDAELQENGSRENAKFAIIEIVPTADPDGEVSMLEVRSYAKLLNVTYNK